MFLLVLFMQICSWLVLTVNLLVVIVWQLDLQLSMQSMMFNATFNNISVISWRSVVLVEETGVPRKNNRKSLTCLISYCCIEYTSSLAGFKLTTLALIKFYSNCLLLQWWLIKIIADKFFFVFVWASFNMQHANGLKIIYIYSIKIVHKDIYICP
jgi:hypothetical protein